MKQNIIDKVDRYLKGFSSKDEIELVESMFLNGEENGLLRQMLENEWRQVLEKNANEDIDLGLQLDRIHHIIRIRESSKPKTLQKFIRIYSKVAAILLLPIILSLIGYLYLNQSSHKSTQIGYSVDQTVFTSIYAPLGARVSFNLPDGSSGMLNSGSTLSYSIPFGINRQVKLEGEAWFEVKKDEKHPFEVFACNTAVRVLGTSFNLSAYPSENYLELVLNKGKVEFRDLTKNHIISMAPSDKLVFQDGHISKTIVDPEKYNAWIDGKLIFRGDPMSEVARRIERWYNVKITIADTELDKYVFRATFMDDSLEEVLNFLCMTSPIKFKIIPKHLFEDGTYKKQEVMLYKK